MLGSREFFLLATLLVGMLLLLPTSHCRPLRPKSGEQLAFLATSDSKFSLAVSSNFSSFMRVQESELDKQDSGIDWASQLPMFLLFGCNETEHLLMVTSHSLIMLLQ